MEKDDVIYMYIKDSKLDMESIMNNYTGYIWSIVKNSTNLSKEDIEEIISDVFVTLWNNQAKLDVERKLSLYLAGITKNLIKKKYRYIQLKDNIEDFEEKIISTENIENSYQENEIEKIIRNEIEKLKKEDKDIFISYYYYSRKIKEIAIEFNISESKVKTKLHRLRNRIKKVLEKRGYSYDG